MADLIKNFNISGVSDNVQLGKQGGKIAFGENGFSLFESDGSTSADLTLNNININGDLTIAGTSTTVNSQDLTVSDNLIEINSEESGAGVSLGTAGIDINRG